MLDLDWEGPLNVGPHHLQLDNRESWAAEHDGRVPRFRKKLRKKMADGEHLKPVVLVRTPGSEHDVIADGHHRVLASIDEGQPVWAYVGRAETVEGPWDEMHSSQMQINRK